MVDKILEALTVHTYIENEGMYPAVRDLLPDLENVSHHMDEEEQDWFPQVRDGPGRKQLQEIGARMIELRKKAPSRPSQPSALKKAADAVLA